MQPVILDTFKKLTIYFLSFVSVWNLLKFPYLIKFYSDGEKEYRERGLELSIHMGHWVEGYRSAKMRSCPWNFLLLHSVLGITILIMMILTLLNKKWRRKYCVPFFWFGIIEGIHAFPICYINDSKMRMLFILACFLLVIPGIWGLHTNKTYAKNPERAEKHLLIQYILLTITNAAGGVLEMPRIIGAFKYHSEHNEWESFGDKPHKKVGNTPFDKYGPSKEIWLVIFVLYCVAVGIFWPLSLKLKARNAQILPIRVAPTQLTYPIHGSGSKII